jgi:hypothetical protein
MAHGFRWLGEWITGLHLLQDDSVRDSAERISLETDLVGIAIQSRIQVSPRHDTTKTHCKDESSVREHVALCCLEGLKLPLLRSVAHSPFVVLSSLSSREEKLRRRVLNCGALRDAQAPCTPVANRDEAEVGQEGSPL